MPFCMPSTLFLSLLTRRSVTRSATARAVVYFAPATLNRPSSPSSRVIANSIVTLERDATVRFTRAGTAP